MLVWFCIRAKLRAHTLRHPCLARSSRCIDPLYFYNLLKSTSIASPRAKLASLVKGEVLSPEKIRATTGGIAASTHSITTTLCPAPPPSPYKRSADSPSTLIKTHPHSPFSPRVSPQLLLRFPHRQPRRRPTRNRICSSARRSAPLCLASPAFQPF